MDKRKDALDYIIQNKEIKTVFQPIISLRDGGVLGYEALSRITCESEIKNPDTLFTAAEEYNRLWDLELLCRTKALEAAYVFMAPPYNKKLFMNVNANIMHDKTFKEGFTRGFLAQYEITPHKVIFEISERSIITDMNSFKETIDHYKSQDYKIAIDDAGAGYSGLNLVSDVNPNYIKLDMNLIRNVNKDNLKYALVKGMVEFSKLSNIFLIAEGIETFEEMNTLVNLGVQYGQGYFIQKPDVEIKEINPEVLNTLKEINLRKNHISQGTISNLYIRNICTPARTVSPRDMIPKVYEIFKNDPDCFGVCVVENDIPVGILTKERLTFHLSGYYGFALHQNKPISKIMDKDYLSVDYKTSVRSVSSMAMSRPSDKLYDFIVVTEDEKYIGVVTIIDLLRKTIEIDVSTAKHQNPLTGLPGNVIIEQKLGQCINGGHQYSVAYLDIDNFKAYNDVYGFENGDLIIKLLAEILRGHISEDQFIGHIGGDDFVVIIDDHVADNYFKDITRQFEQEVLALYNETDIQNGFIIAKNRRGEVERFPLMTLTAVSINNKTRTFKNVPELSGVLAGLKTVAKQGNFKYNPK
jgi:diguanylate cyclase (GGDEF)-like protein